MRPTKLCGFPTKAPWLLPMMKKCFYGTSAVNNAFCGAVPCLSLSWRWPQKRTHSSSSRISPGCCKSGRQPINHRSIRKHPSFTSRESVDHFVFIPKFIDDFCSDDPSYLLPSNLDRFLISMIRVVNGGQKVQRGAARFCSARLNRSWTWPAVEGWDGWCTKHLEQILTGNPR